MSSILHPNVHQIGPKVDVGRTDGPHSKDPAEKLEKGQESFNEVLKRLDLESHSPIKSLKFSAHATERLMDRGITYSPELMTKISDAVNKAEAKGSRNSLILTPDSALIVSVTNRTVITAMDREQMDENVFTNIDSAVLVQS